MSAKDNGGIEESRRWTQPESRGTAAPAPLLGSTAQAGADWVLVDVPREREEVRIALHELGEVAPFEDVTRESVTPVDTQSVSLVQPPHSKREIRFRRLEEEVVVIGHHAVGMATPAAITRDVLEARDE